MLSCEHASLACFITQMSFCQIQAHRSKNSTTVGLHFQCHICHFKPKWMVKQKRQVSCTCRLTSWMEIDCFLRQMQLEVVEVTEQETNCLVGEKNKERENERKDANGGNCETETKNSLGETVEAKVMGVKK